MKNKKKIQLVLYHVLNSPLNHNLKLIEGHEKIRQKKAKVVTQVMKGAGTVVAAASVASPTAAESCSGSIINSSSRQQQQITTTTVQGGFAFERIRLVRRVRHHYDLIRHSLSAIRADDTDALLATRAQARVGYVSTYPFACENSLI